MSKPKPRVIYCLCTCHRSAKANWREEVQREHYLTAIGMAEAANVVRFAEAADPIEAASACNECLNNHCSALLERRIWFDPREDEATRRAVADATAWTPAEGAED